MCEYDFNFAIVPFDESVYKASFSARRAFDTQGGSPAADSAVRSPVKRSRAQPVRPVAAIVLPEVPDLADITKNHPIKDEDCFC